MWDELGSNVDWGGLSCKAPRLYVCRLIAKEHGGSSPRHGLHGWHGLHGLRHEKPCQRPASYRTVYDRMSTLPDRSGGPSPSGSAGYITPKSHAHRPAAHPGKHHGRQAAGVRSTLAASRRHHRGTHPRRPWSLLGGSARPCRGPQRTGTTETVPAVRSTAPCPLSVQRRSQTGHLPGQLSGHRCICYQTCLVIVQSYSPLTEEERSKLGCVHWGMNGLKRAMGVGLFVKAETSCCRGGTKSTWFGGLRVVGLTPDEAVSSRAARRLCTGRSAERRCTCRARRTGP